MKGFLVDENLPGQLASTPSLPMIHALDFGAQLTDSELWIFAKSRYLVIVAKDADFSDRILASTPPPWIVQLRFGNMRRKEFNRFLTALWPQVESLLPSNKLICVYADRIEAFG